MRAVSKRSIRVPLVGALTAAALLGGIAPAASAAPASALLPAAAGSRAAPASGLPAAGQTLAGYEVIEVEGFREHLRAVRIPVPGSKVPSSITVALDRQSIEGHTMPYEREPGGAMKAEAFVKRIAENLKKIASRSKGKTLLEGVSLMRPLDVASEQARAATGRADVNTIFFRGFPEDRSTWPDDVRKEFESRSPRERSETIDSFLVNDPGAIAFDVRRRSNGIGSESMIAMPDDPFVLLGYQPDGKRFALDEPLAVAHELIHAAHNLQGADATLPDNGEIPVEVTYKDPRGRDRTDTAYTDAEELGTLGGKARKKYLASATGDSGKRRFAYEHLNRSWEQVKKAVKESSGAVQKALKRAKEGRRKTLDLTETDLAGERGVPAREHYALPDGFWADWPDRYEELVKLPPGLVVTDKDLKNPDALVERIEQAQRAVLRSCSPGRRSMACRLNGRPENVSEETKRRIEETGRLLKEEPDAPDALPWEDDAVADREQIRNEAVAEAKKLPGRARERAEELCATSGLASCLETVDWKKVAEQERAKVEKITELKLAGVENLSDVRLAKDLKTVTEDPSAFYVPYEKTRTELGGNRFDWEHVIHAGGAVLWAHGVVEAFSGESTDLDKAAAVTALLPVVGSLLQVGVDVQDKDFAGAGVDGFALLVEGLEVAGVESAVGGPAFALAMAYHLTKAWTDHIRTSEQELLGLPAERDKQWRKLLDRYLQDGKQGWPAKKGGTEAVAAGIGLVQAMEMQRAAVKGLAHAASTATESGTVDPDEAQSQEWSGSEQFKKADAKVDDLTGSTPELVRSALAKALKNGFDAVWSEKTGQDFNQQFIDKANGFATSTWCAPDIGNHGGGGRYAQCLETMRGEQRGVVDKLKSTPPAGLSVAEIEDVLEAMGMSDPGFLQPVDTPRHLQLATGEAARYLSVAAGGGAVEHRASLDRPDLQTFVFHPTGRISTLDGERCLVAGDSAGTAVSTAACENLRKQRWRPDGDGRLFNVATGLLLGTEPAGRVVMVADNEQASSLALWKAVVPARDARPQKDSPALAGLLAAKGASRRVDAVMPAPGLEREYWVFSGNQYQRIRLDEPDGTTVAATVTGNGAPAAITDNWSSLAALLAASKAGRVDAAMPVPGSDRRFYVFSGDRYTRIRLDDDLKDDNEGYDSRSLDQWASLKDLFGKSGVTRVDAVRPVSADSGEYQVFSGAWFTTIRVEGDDTHKDTQVVPPRRIADGWSLFALNTGTDRIQALLPVPGTDGDYYAFTDDSWTRVNGRGLRLPAPAGVTADARVNFPDTFGEGYVYWGDASVPAGTQVVIRAYGLRDERTYPFTKHGSDRFNVPKGLIANTVNYGFFYRYTHPDGVIEDSPEASVHMWCSTFECGGMPQH
ncbi:RICIN domain-containing protein [Streptomyces morookaense]|uniref:Ricin B lectin domain-containing protein n=1 Tax=Streptomyces morookaense TaxID=1970 RepID=A0A7Y7AZS0_STRMO|nr:RICIN domain-containing protein [Streptomyces morookaense]NVK76378.1 hypothetical protein [Streptomyces morookaense]